MDDPHATKRGQLATCERLLAELDFELSSSTAVARSRGFALMACVSSGWAAGGAT
jgi:hypothetical protein